MQIIASKCTNVSIYDGGLSKSNDKYDHTIYVLSVSRLSRIQLSVWRSFYTNKMLRKRKNFAERTKAVSSSCTALKLNSYRVRLDTHIHLVFPCNLFNDVAEMLNVDNERRLNWNLRRRSESNQSRNWPGEFRVCDFRGGGTSVTGIRIPRLSGGARSTVSLDPIDVRVSLLSRSILRSILEDRTMAIPICRRGGREAREARDSRSVCANNEERKRKRSADLT